MIAPKQGYPLQVSQACRGIKIAPKEATYEQRLPSPSLKKLGDLTQTGATSELSRLACVSSTDVQIEHAPLSSS